MRHVPQQDGQPLKRLHLFRLIRCLTLIDQVSSKHHILAIRTQGSTIFPCLHFLTPRLRLMVIWWVLTSHMMCRPRSLAPAGPSAAARPSAATAARAYGGARQVMRPHVPAAAARHGRTVLAGTAASRLSKALQDVPMLDATVKGGTSVFSRIITSGVYCELEITDCYWQ